MACCAFCPGLHKSKCVLVEREVGNKVGEVGIRY